MPGMANGPPLRMPRSRARPPLDVLTPPARVCIRTDRFGSSEAAPDHHRQRRGCRHRGTAVGPGSAWHHPTPPPARAPGTATSPPKEYPAALGSPSPTPGMSPPAPLTIPTARTRHRAARPFRLHRELTDPRTGPGTCGRSLRTRRALGYRMSAGPSSGCWGYILPKRRRAAFQLPCARMSDDAYVRGSRGIRRRVPRCRWPRTRRR